MVGRAADGTSSAGGKSTAQLGLVWGIQAETERSGVSACDIEAVAGQYTKDDTLGRACWTRYNWRLAVIRC